MSATVFKAYGFEDAGLGILGRVRDVNDGTLILQADFGSITCYVYNKDDSTDSGTAVTVTVSSAVKDTIQTDANRWHDTTGYNFDHIIPASVLATGGTMYLIEYTFIPTTGEQSKGHVEYDARETRVS